jgi:hypothetical protein
MKIMLLLLLTDATIVASWSTTTTTLTNNNAMIFKNGFMNTNYDSRHHINVSRQQQLSSPRSFIVEHSDDRRQKKQSMTTLYSSPSSSAASIISADNDDEKDVVDASSGLNEEEAFLLAQALEEIQTDDDVNNSNNPNSIPILNVDASSGLNEEEFKVLVKTIEDCYAETIGLDAKIIITNNNRNTQNTKNNTDNEDNSSVVIGTLGRVLALRSNLDEESIKLLRSSIAERMDSLIYETGQLNQPVLLSIQQISAAATSTSTSTSIAGNNDNSVDNNTDDVNTIIENEIYQYGLRIPVHSNDDTGRSDEDGEITTMYTPTIRIEIDGANTQMINNNNSETTTTTATTTPTTTFWDTSSVVVFDELISNDLRKRMLDVVNGRSSSSSKSLVDNNDDWNDVINGPDPNRWIRGGIQDVPDTDDEDEVASLGCWGLPSEAIEDICFKRHDAIDEFESILTDLFPQFVVTRLPESVYGEYVSPLTANAPIAGEDDDDDNGGGVYDYHIDGDPMSTPPSPWTDVYGRYPNRSRGKPRFMSCLVYLNEEWDGDTWGAPTRFYDPPTEESYDVLPRPGRCVIMDQDIMHTVVPPNYAAGNRPRYSFVWKLILHPKTDHQDMTNLSSSSSRVNTSNNHSRSSWPEPILFGSAAQ